MLSFRRVLRLQTDMSGAAKADLVVLAVPSFAVASTAEQLAKIVPPHTVIVNVGKGLDSKHGYCGSPRPSRTR